MCILSLSQSLSLSLSDSPLSPSVSLSLSTSLFVSRSFTHTLSIYLSVCLSVGVYNVEKTRRRKLFSFPFHHSFLSLCLFSSPSSCSSLHYLTLCIRIAFVTLLFFLAPSFGTHFCCSRFHFCWFDWTRLPLYSDVLPFRYEVFILYIWTIYITLFVLCAHTRARVHTHILAYPFHFAFHHVERKIRIYVLAFRRKNPVFI